MNPTRSTPVRRCSRPGGIHARLRRVRRSFYPARLHRAPRSRSVASGSAAGAPPRLVGCARCHDWFRSRRCAAAGRLVVGPVRAPPHVVALEVARTKRRQSSPAPPADPRRLPVLAERSQERAVVASGDDRRGRGARPRPPPFRGGPARTLNEQGGTRAAVRRRRYGIIGILVIILLIVLIFYFARRA